MDKSTSKEVVPEIDLNDKKEIAFEGLEEGCSRQKLKEKHSPKLGMSLSRSRKVLCWRLVIEERAKRGENEKAAR